MISCFKIRIGFTVANICYSPNQKTCPGRYCFKQPWKCHMIFETGADWVIRMRYDSRGSYMASLIYHMTQWLFADWLNGSFKKSIFGCRRLFCGLHKKQLNDLGLFYDPAHIWRNNFKHANCTIYQIAFLSLIVIELK